MKIDSTTRYDAKAIVFRRECGFLPPGKDSPAASGPYPDEYERRVVWNEWLARYGVTINRVFDAIEELTAPLDDEPLDALAADDANEGT